MSSVSETIVREYFELHEFLVRQTRKYIRQTRSAEDDDIEALGDGFDRQRANDASANRLGVALRHRLY